MEMNAETKKNKVVLTPTNPENWLTNDEGVFTKRVACPLSADVSEWHEVTNEEKEAWEAEHAEEEQFQGED